MPTVVIEQLFSNQASFFVPEGVTAIDVLLVAGGGAGGTGNSAGGGGAGQVLELLALVVTPGQRFAYTIGTPGFSAGPVASQTTFGANTALPGTRGGDTSTIAAPRNSPAGYNTGGAGTSSTNSTPDGIPGAATNFIGGNGSPDGTAANHSGGGGGGQSGVGGAGVASTGGSGGAGVNMSANWGTDYGLLGFFGGGGAGSSTLNPGSAVDGGGNGNGSPGRTRSGGGGGAPAGIGATGTILVKYTLPDPDTDPGNLAVASYLETRLSGGAVNPNSRTSLGGVLSFYAPVQLLRGNIFSDITEAQRVAGSVHYRCLYLVNTHPTLSMANLTIWLEGLPVNAATTMAIGDDPAAVNVAAASVANETTAPNSVTFSSPTTYGSGINLGTLASGNFVAFWVRRTVTAAASALMFDRLRLGLQFD